MRFLRICNSVRQHFWTLSELLQSLPVAHITSEIKTACATPAQRSFTMTLFCPCPSLVSVSVPVCEGTEMTLPFSIKTFLASYTPRPNPFPSFTTQTFLYAPAAFVRSKCRCDLPLAAVSSLRSPFLCRVIPRFHRMALAGGLLSSLMLLQGFGRALSVINAGTIYHLPASGSGGCRNRALSGLYSPHLAADLSPGRVGGELAESRALGARRLRPATSC